ncbi:hypothetical protein C84B14_07333 [Salinisphaera sp. C84B14]|uniref:hypothetical protein n=1 Tax=Salinisphaera sp. C84B14 TaxID=1304155 RepID=UPI00333EC3B3
MTEKRAIPGQGVQVIGVDQWGWEPPFHMQIAKARKDNDTSLFRQRAAWWVARSPTGKWGNDVGWTSFRPMDST